MYKFIEYKLPINIKKLAIIFKNIDIFNQYNKYYNYVDNNYVIHNNYHARKYRTTNVVSVFYEHSKYKCIVYHNSFDSNSVIKLIAYYKADDFNYESIIKYSELALQPLNI